MLTLEIVGPEVIPRWWSYNSNLWNLATSGTKGVGIFAWASRDGAGKKFLFQHTELLTPQT